MVSHTVVCMVLYTIVRHTYVVLVHHCMHGFVYHHWLNIASYTILYVVLCIPSLVVYGFVYHGLHGFVLHQLFKIVAYTIVFAVFYTTTRFTWFRIPAVRYTWFRIPSCIVKSFVFVVYVNPQPCTRPCKHACE